MSVKRQGSGKKAPAKAKAAAKAPAKAKTKAKATAKSRAGTKAPAKARAKPGAGGKSKRGAAVGSVQSRSFEPYKPKRGEEYMSDGQLEHFRTILENWKSELMEEVDRTIHHLRDEASNFPDINDRASQEAEFGLELRTRDRERKLIRKISAALERISQGTYGYCEKTGEEIGLSRLEARPIATMSVEAQERYEKAGRHYGD